MSGPFPTAGPTKYTPSLRVADQLAKAFRSHKLDEEQSQRVDEVRHAHAWLADLLTKVCPESRELSLALTKIEEAGMFAVAAIARESLGGGK